MDVHAQRLFFKKTNKLLISVTKNLNRLSLPFRFPDNTKNQHAIPERQN
jgi:hypothetical protein